MCLLYSTRPLSLGEVTQPLRSTKNASETESLGTTLLARLSSHATSLSSPTQYRTVYSRMYPVNTLSSQCSSRTDEPLRQISYSGKNHHLSQYAWLSTANAQSRIGKRLASDPIYYLQCAISQKLCTYLARMKDFLSTFRWASMSESSLSSRASYFE